MNDSQAALSQEVPGAVPSGRGRQAGEPGDEGLCFIADRLLPLEGAEVADICRRWSATPIEGDALTREQALRGMTIWAARSNFEEHEKGSLEKGKFADFIILDKDLMTIPAKEVLQTKVLATFIGGEKVYSNNEN